MLVLHRLEQRWEDCVFRDFPSFLRPGDCLALNDSRVFPSRLLGRRAGVHSLPIGRKNPKRREYLSGEVEIFLLKPLSMDSREWEALVRPGRKLRTGERVSLGGGLEAEILGRGDYGGHVPLPPYIKRPDAPLDRERYQTVFARERGSAAAPTAGLHFTPEILDQCRRAGAEIAYVTRHVGLGTFQPLHPEQIASGKLHPEPYAISPENGARLRGASRIVAAGTTTLRTLETAARGGALQGETDLFISPGFEFQAAGALLTNFHLPRTSLLLLVCAFAGTELTLAAYRHAVESRYRFFSYGDCMLIV
jgi:S-adenosylmethionine:tRNA ribosyltransferase-isomerase